MNYYEILGVSKNASQDDIKKAYKEQAKKWHPDVNKSPIASDMFKKVKEAYDVLSNSITKDAYNDNSRVRPERKDEYSYKGKNLFRDGVDVSLFKKGLNKLESFLGYVKMKEVEILIEACAYDKSITLNTAKLTINTFTYNGDRLRKMRDEITFETKDKMLVYSEIKQYGDEYNLYLTFKGEANTITNTCNDIMSVIKSRKDFGYKYKLN